jgi:branched-chain amino acid aminotransferase
MTDNAGRFCVYGNKVLDAAQMPEKAANSSVYEVIRVIDGVPLFFEDHFARMQASLKTLGIEGGLEPAGVKSEIIMLVGAEDKSCCNVKISVIIEDGSPKPLYYISKSYYPPAEVVDAGVKTGLIRLERNNPNAKILNYSYKEAVTRRIEDGGFFEVLLVNSDENITEGSKSNVFFVRGNRITTTPGSAVLLGVTRKYVMEACRLAGYPVEEEFTPAAYLGQTLCDTADGSRNSRREPVDALFLSGTSIKVLPVSSVDGVTFNSSENSIVREVARQYDLLISRYVTGNKPDAKV